jgi:hypothetical protein
MATLLGVGHTACREKLMLEADRVRLQRGPMSICAVLLSIKRCFWLLTGIELDQLPVVNARYPISLALSK